MFGGILRDYRLRAGYSQKQLGILIGINRGSISRYEKWGIVPRKSVAKKIVAILNIPDGEDLWSKYRRTEITQESILKMRFGKLQPVCINGYYIIPSTKQKVLIYTCLCDCGKYKDVPYGNLTQKLTKSCGCLIREGKDVKVTDHPLYTKWTGMRGRCNNVKDKAYKIYGGRGIKVCERWRIFQNFVNDMGGCPSDEHSIDRIDNDGDYTPENCRWATQQEQMRNTRRTINLTYDGRTQCLQAWADERGLSKQTLSLRLKKGWSVVNAITTKSSFGNKKGG